jgi:hypothetical protein
VNDRQGVVLVSAAPSLDSLISGGGQGQIREATSLCQRHLGGSSTFRHPGIGCMPNGLGAGGRVGSADWAVSDAHRRRQDERGSSAL